MTFKNTLSGEELTHQEFVSFVWDEAERQYNEYHDSDWSNRTKEEQLQYYCNQYEHQLNDRNWVQITDGKFHVKIPNGELIVEAKGVTEEYPGVFISYDATGDETTSLLLACVEHDTVTNAIKTTTYDSIHDEPIGIFDFFNTESNVSENAKVLQVVDEALTKYGTNVISVDRDNETGEMIHVNLCFGNSSDIYMANVAHFDKCNLDTLEKELDERHVGHCW